MKKISSSLRKSTRFAAVEILTQVEYDGAYSNLLLNDYLKKSEASASDKHLLTELVYGTISRKLTLAYYLQPFIEKAKKVEPWVEQLLLLSIFQLVYLDRIPAHAILNEAVEIGKQRGNSGTGKFVNGVLRSFQRKGPLPLTMIKDPIERLAIEISLPLWLAERLVAQLGLKETRQLGLSLFEPSHVSARVNTNKISRAEAIASLRKEGIVVEKSAISPFGVVASKGYLAGTSLFLEGLLTIQDETSMLVAPTMQIRPDFCVLDACAAPGGKTTHIASYLDYEQEGKVYALDLHKHKTRLIMDNAMRLGVTDVVEVQQLDARSVGSVFPDDFFDCILVDAPCSGLGLMRRKPEIKYTKKKEDFLQLQTIQLEILDSVSSKVKKNGTITYSTCTITKEENQNVADQFLSTHSGFEQTMIQVPENISASIVKRSLMVYPHQYGTDGFFISSFRRVN